MPCDRRALCKCAAGDLTTYTFNPFEDQRWAALVRSHRCASVFHTPGYLRALQRTYGYEPVVYSTSPASATLTNGVVLCRVRSWLTGSRLVSLPFADHCEPLVDDAEQRAAILAAIGQTVRQDRLKYAEIRSTAPEFAGASHLEAASSFFFHALDLRPTLDGLYKRIHKTALQQQIRRAEREAVRHDQGTSQELLDKFYRLLVLTRRRHQLPPQPLLWFQNLIASLGDRAQIHLGSIGERPIAGMLTLRHNTVLVYKYGCSDARFHRLGAVPFLLWKAIVRAKESGLDTLDMGRCDTGNTGLMTFKERWGATSSSLTYLRYSSGATRDARVGLRSKIATQLFGRLPGDLLIVAGRLLYRHIG
jgi:CelD/BcsL family acetyltransferase involved in cellulose biosynthesis